MTSEVTKLSWPQTSPLGVSQSSGLIKGQPGSLALLSVPALVESEGAHPRLQEGVLKTDSHGNALGRPEPGVCPEGGEAALVAVALG